MERHYVNESKKGLAYTLIAIGLILVLVTLVNVIKAMVALETEPFEWTSVLYFIQGLSLVLMGLFQLRSRKYYIEWSADELNCFLSRKKGIERIRIADIKSVEIKLFEIHIKLKEEEIVINLENAQFKSIRKIKDMFEELRSSFT